MTAGAIRRSRRSRVESNLQAFTTVAEKVFMMVMNRFFIARQILPAA
jgi:hypothetical protein